MFRRPVTPVTRAESHRFGRLVRGAPIGEVLPAPADAELASFVLRDRRDHWRREVGRAGNWTRHVWVDLGLLTFVRATVTLREGRLVSEREALDALPGPGAPAEVVEDVRRRRHGDAPPRGRPARRRRVDRAPARLTRDYPGPAIDAPAAGS